MLGKPLSLLLIAFVAPDAQAQLPTTTPTCPERCKADTGVGWVPPVPGANPGDPPQNPNTPVGLQVNPPVPTQFVTGSHGVSVFVFVEEAKKGVCVMNPSNCEPGAECSFKVSGAVDDPGLGGMQQVGGFGQTTNTLVGTASTWNSESKRVEQLNPNGYDSRVSVLALEDAINCGTIKVFTLKVWFFPGPLSGGQGTANEMWPGHVSPVMSTANTWQSPFFNLVCTSCDQSWWDLRMLPGQG